MARNILLLSWLPCSWWTQFFHTSILSANCSRKTTHATPPSDLHLKAPNQELLTPVAPLALWLSYRKHSARWGLCCSRVDWEWSGASIPQQPCWLHNCHWDEPGLKISRGSTCSRGIFYLRSNMPTKSRKSRLQGVWCRPSRHALQAVPVW